METLPAPPPELFVKLGVLDAEKLKRCIEFQETFHKQGLSLPLAHVILNLGMAKPEQVARVLAHQTTAPLCGPPPPRPPPAPQVPPPPPAPPFPAQPAATNVNPA